MLYARHPQKFWNVFKHHNHIYICVCVCVFVCMCYRPPVRGVCPNYEVVEFQPWKVTHPQPRICCLLLHIYTFPAPPSIPIVLCPYGGGGIPLLNRRFLHWCHSCLRTGSSTHMGITCLLPIILMFPAYPISFAVHAPPLWPSLAPATPARFLLTQKNSDSSWQYFPDTGRSTGAYIIFYQGGPIDHGTHVPGQVSQSNAES